MPLRPSLHQSLYSSLQSTPTDELKPRTFELTTLCTKPFRTHTLFPHALDPTVSVLRIDYLVTLAERLDDYRSKDLPPPQITVPVFALEASLYTIPTTAVQILYISKIDTTGLSPLPAPAGQLTSAFLSHFIQNVPKSVRSLRIHIFARAAREGQYLFPASAENAPNGPGDGARLAAALASGIDSNGGLASRPMAGKRLLNDQQLVRWWHKTLSKVVVEHQASQPKKPLECFYTLPGFDENESAEVLPVSKELKELWNYGHPYNKIATPLSQTNPNMDGKQVYLLSELIPAFNDDPKSRFLHSIGDCSTNTSGEPGDWDDAIVERSSASLEKDRNRERSKINQITPDEFWDRMGARQECCDGRVSAFFVVVLSQPPSNGSQKAAPEEPVPSTQEDLQSITSNSSTLVVSNNGSANVLDEVPKPLVGVFKNDWISLWSKIHNKDYAKLETASSGYLGWIEDVKSSINSTIQEDQLKKKNHKTNKNVSTIKNKEGGDKEELPLSFDNCHSVILVNNPLKNPILHQNASGVSKRSLVDQDKTTTQVNVLQPRKKSKK